MGFDFTGWEIVFQILLQLSLVVFTFLYSYISFLEGNSEAKEKLREISDAAVNINKIISKDHLNNVEKGYAEKAAIENDMELKKCKIKLDEYLNTINILEDFKNNISNEIISEVKTHRESQLKTMIESKLHTLLKLTEQELENHYNKLFRVNLQCSQKYQGKYVIVVPYELPLNNKILKISTYANEGLEDDHSK